jgi:hypothetical protein
MEVGNCLLVGLVGLNPLVLQPGLGLASGPGVTRITESWWLGYRRGHNRSARRRNYLSVTSSFITPTLS